MTAAIEDLADTVDLEGLRSVVAETDVRYAVVFGSYATRAATATSDLDIGVRFADECSRRDRFRQRNRIDAAAQSYADPFVDVHDLETVPDHVAVRALQEGLLWYGDAETKAMDERRLTRRLAETNDQRTRRRREFVDRLAEGDV